MEIWKDIKGYEGIYQVSSLGEVKSLERYEKCEGVHKGRYVRRRKGRIMIQSFNKDRYFVISMWKKGIQKTLYVHRLVSQAFLPNPRNKPWVNHKNGVKTDNTVENLEWATEKEDTQHALRMGLKSVGENHPNSKLNEKQVRVIKHLKNIKPKMTQLEVSKVFKVGRYNISSIQNNRIWKHVTI